MCDSTCWGNNAGTPRFYGNYVFMDSAYHSRPMTVSSSNVIENFSNGNTIDTLTHNIFKSDQFILNEDIMWYFAVFSLAAYDDDNKHNVTGFIMDSDLSTPDARVYRHKELSFVVVAFRGTVLYRKEPRWGDLIADFNLFIGTAGRWISSRFNTANKLMEKVLAKYPRDSFKLCLTGHSLGGAQALNVYETYGHDIDTYVYNPGVSPWDWRYMKYFNMIFPQFILSTLLNSMSRSYFNKNSVAYITKYDPIGGFARGLQPNGLTVVIVKQTMKDPHSLGNFLPDSYQDLVEQFIYGRTTH